MKRIIVIGSPGSGKSTFSRKLNILTNIPLYHLDLIWHKPDKTNVTKEVFDKELFEILKQDSWIIDGNYQRTLIPRIEACDTVCFFDLPTALCIKGVKKRMGSPRPDMPWVEEELDPIFMEYILNFEKERLPGIYEALKQYPNKNIYIFNNHIESEQFLKNIK